MPTKNSSNKKDIYDVLVYFSSDQKAAGQALRQLPEGSNNCWGKYRFFINGGTDNPDVVVVRNKSIKQKTILNIPPENTILLLSEPKSVVDFPEKYCRQFHVVHSCQKDLKHSNVVYGQAALPWFVYAAENGSQPITYDWLKRSPMPLKTKLMSVITSNKAFTKGHQERIDFVAKLKRHYCDQIDVFGRGFRTFDEKWEVLAPYKYHIALENSSAEYYWTEKLSDAYLAGAFPIYYGCTNVADYFPQGSFAAIDIHNFERSVNIIDDIIKNDTYEKSLPSLAEARRLVIDKYNIFNVIAELCDTLDLDALRQQVTLKPAVSAGSWRNLYAYVVERNYYNLKAKMKSLFGGKANL